MLHVIVLVKPFRAEKVLEAIESQGATAIRVCEAKGFGRQKERLPLYLGSEYGDAFLPKIEISFCLEDDAQLDSIAKVVTEQGRTGRMGDGKIFVFRCVDDLVECF